MKLNMKLEYGDAEMMVVANPVDIVAFEDEFGRGVESIFSGGLKIKDICWLAWHSCRRRKVTTFDFTEWLQDLGEIEVEEGKTVPLDPAPSPG